MSHSSGVVKVRRLLTPCGIAVGVLMVTTVLTSVLGGVSVAEAQSATASTPLYGVVADPTPVAAAGCQLTIAPPRARPAGHWWLPDDEAIVANSKRLDWQSPQRFYRRDGIPTVSYLAHLDQFDPSEQYVGIEVQAPCESEPPVISGDRWVVMACDDQTCDYLLVDPDSFTSRRVVSFPRFDRPGFDFWTQGHVAEMGFLAFVGNTGSFIGYDGTIRWSRRFPFHRASHGGCLADPTVKLCLWRGAFPNTAIDVLRISDGAVVRRGLRRERGFEPEILPPNPARVVGLQDLWLDFGGTPRPDGVAIRLNGRQIRLTADSNRTVTVVAGGANPWVATIEDFTSLSVVGGRLYVQRGNTLGASDCVDTELLQILGKTGAVRTLQDIDGKDYGSRTGRLCSVQFFGVRRGWLYYGSSAGTYRTRFPIQPQT